MKFFNKDVTDHRGNKTGGEDSMLAARWHAEAPENHRGIKAILIGKMAGGAHDGQPAMVLHFDDDVADVVFFLDKPSLTDLGMGALSLVLGVEDEGVFTGAHE